MSGSTPIHAIDGFSTVTKDDAASQPEMSGYGAFSRGSPRPYRKARLTRPTKLDGSLWIPDWSKKTTVGSTMTDDGTGSLFSTIIASYTTPLWLAEKANLRKIS